MAALRLAVSANANAASLALVDPAIRDNPGIYPPDAVKANLFAVSPHADAFDSKLIEAWTRVTTGQ